MKNTINNNKINNNEKNTKEIPKKKKILALPMGDDNEPIQISQFTLNEAYTRTVEPAGEKFELIVSKKLNPEQFDLLHNDDGEDEEIIEEDKQEYEWEKEYRASKKYSNGFKMQKNKKKEKIENYYSLMGVEEQFINVTPEELRKAIESIYENPEFWHNKISIVSVQMTWKSCTFALWCLPIECARCRTLARYF